MTTTEKQRCCNRWACKSIETPSWWWNPSTRAWYCQKCALAINDGTYPQLCIQEINLPDLTPVSAEDLQKVLKEAQFLCDRLDEFDPDDCTVSDYYGHVSPSHSRLKAILDHITGGVG